MAPRTKMTPEEVAQELAEHDPPIEVANPAKRNNGNGVNKEITLTTEAPSLEQIWAREEKS